MAPTSLTKVILLVSLFSLGAWAQISNVECGPGFGWNRNSLGEDPCTVGSKLDASCRNISSYPYPPLNENQWYTPPRKNTKDLDCDCNTVMYNIYMACTACQGAYVYSWTSWLVACQTTDIAQLPFSIPQGTAVPHWAYFNVTSAVNQKYNGTTMISIGRDPEGRPNTTNTSSPTHSPTSTPNPTDGAGVSAQRVANIAAIVGGVLGTVVPLATIATVACACHPICHSKLSSIPR